MSIAKLAFVKTVVDYYREHKLLDTAKAFGISDRTVLRYAKTRGFKKWKMNIK